MPLPVKVRKIPGNSIGRDIVVDSCDLTKIRTAFTHKAAGDRIFIGADIFLNDGSIAGNLHTWALFKLLMSKQGPEYLYVVRKAHFASSVQATITAFDFKYALNRTATRGTRKNGAGLKSLFFDDCPDVSITLLDRLTIDDRKRIIQNLNDIEGCAFSGSNMSDQAIDRYLEDVSEVFYSLEKELYQKYWLSLRKETAWVRNMDAAERQSAARFIETFPRSFEVAAVIIHGNVVKGTIRVPAKKGIDFSDVYSGSLEQSVSTSSPQTTQASSFDDLASVDTLDHAVPPFEIPSLLGIRKRSSSFADPLFEEMKIPSPPINDEDDEDLDGCIEFEAATEEDSVDDEEQSDEDSAFIDDFDFDLDRDDDDECVVHDEAAINALRNRPRGASFCGTNCTPSLLTGGSNDSVVVVNQKLVVAAITASPLPSTGSISILNSTQYAVLPSNTLRRQLMRGSAAQQLKELNKVPQGNIIASSTAEYIDQEIQRKADELAKNAFGKPSLSQQKEMYNDVLKATLDQLSSAQRIALVVHFKQYSDPGSQTLHLLALEQHTYLNYFCFFYKREKSSMDTNSMHTAIHTLLEGHKDVKQEWQGKILTIKTNNNEDIIALERHTSMFKS